MSSSDNQKLSDDETRILKEALENLKLNLEKELRSLGVSSILSPEEVEVQEDIRDIDNLLKNIMYDQLFISEQ